jgi:putative membrane protein
VGAVTLAGGASGRLHVALGVAAALVLAWSGWMPRDRLTWVLESAPAMIAAGIVAWLYPRWRFTPLALVLVTVHAVILMVGAKYTYAEVPAFGWLRDEFGLARNYYDRLGHFAQGFVPAMVAREILLRNAVLPRGRWLFFVVACICLAISAFYEFIEWWAAVALGQGADAFLGTQGDVWDTQWDMFLALVGAILAQLLFGAWHDRQLAALIAPQGAVAFREVTAENIHYVADLRVAEHQKYHVASVGTTLWQGGRRTDLWIRALYLGEVPVGLVALVDKSLVGEATDEIYLARMLVDRRYQGLGIGRRAIAMVIEHARERPGCRRVRLAHVPSNEAVGRLYQEFGFRHTGTIDEDGELEMELLLDRPPGNS